MWSPLVGGPSSVLIWPSNFVFESPNGKRLNVSSSPLLVHARTTSAWEQLRGYLGRDLTDEELDEARALLVASGSRRFVEDLAERHLGQARTVLDGLGIPVDLLDGMAVGPAVLGDGSEVAA